MSLHCTQGPQSTALVNSPNEATHCTIDTNLISEVTTKSSCNLAQHLLLEKAVVLKWLFWKIFSWKLFTKDIRVDWHHELVVWKTIKLTWKWLLNDLSSTVSQMKYRYVMYRSQWSFKIIIFHWWCQEMRINCQD